MLVLLSPVPTGVTLSPTSEHTIVTSITSTGNPPTADWKRPPACPRGTRLQQLVEDIGLSINTAEFATWNCSTR